MTELAGANRNRNGVEEREFHVKWQLKGGNDLPAVKKQLYLLLTTLLIEFPGHVTFIDRKQREWMFQETNEEERFLKEFETAVAQLHPIKNKQKKVVRWISIATFRSSTGIKDWKENDRFYANLNEAETYLFPHPFGKDDWDITSIGFLKDIHVVHYPKDELHSHICDLIKKQKGQPDHSGP